MCWQPSAVAKHFVALSTNGVSHFYIFFVANFVQNYLHTYGRFHQTLTGCQFVKNLVICVFPTFIWPSTWHKFDRPSTLSQLEFNDGQIQLLRNQPSTPPRSNRVSLLVVDNSLIDLQCNAYSTKNSFSDALLSAYRTTGLQTIGVTMATVNHECHET